jgi:hypothetical protein
MVEEKYSCKNLIIGLFRHHNNMGKAFNAALKLGYKKEELSILMSKETKEKHGYARKHPEPLVTEEALEGAGVGGSLGVTMGAVTGALMALGIFTVISGIGVTISVPIAVFLSGALAGGIAGGLVGALINIGISTNHAEHFKAELKNGAILVILHLRSENDYVKLEREWVRYEGIVLRQLIINN